MEKFTRNEIAWITAALVNESDRLEKLSEQGGVCGSLNKLRSEQLEGLADRFSRALGNGDKRMKIT